MDEMNSLFCPEADATSWIYLILFSIFILACIRVRGNLKFVASFFHDMVAVRERENLFDNTVRETSLIFLALLLSGCSVGVLLRLAVPLYGSYFTIETDLPDLSGFISGEFLPTLVCMGLACAYIAALWLCYTLVGTVFSDPLHTWQWVRGFTASTGVGALVFFPLALLALAYPQWDAFFVIAGFGMLILVKIIFIIKGFRIFFTESSLWVVFLYYLCSLEIVPLLITFGLACSLLG